MVGRESENTGGELHKKFDIWLCTDPEGPSDIFVTQESTNSWPLFNLGHRSQYQKASVNSRQPLINVPQFPILLFSEFAHSLLCFPNHSWFLYGALSAPLSPSPVFPRTGYPLIVMFRELSRALPVLQPLPAQ